MALSNNITAFLNFLALMCSIPIIASGIWLASKQDNECIRWLRWPVVFLGIAVLLVCLTGFVGAYWKKEGLLGVYLVCMAILIVLLLVFLVLAFVVSRPSGAYSVPGRVYMEYRLDGFSSWLRNHITGSDNWGKISACLADSGICPKLNQEFISAEQFFAAHLSPIQVISLLLITYVFSPKFMLHLVNFKKVLSLLLVLRNENCSALIGCLGIYI